MAFILNCCGMKMLVNAAAGATLAWAGPHHWLYTLDFLVVVKTSQKQFSLTEGINSA